MNSQMFEIIVAFTTVSYVDWCSVFPTLAIDVTLMYLTV